jgi:two-component system sensor histidine kinase KdpD
MHGTGRRVVRLLVVAGGSLLAATAAIVILEQAAGVENASSAYLVAVVIVALLDGTAAAILTAIGSAALYNYLFTDPRYTFIVHEPGVLLNVVLLLFVGVVVGQLAALQRQRADTARDREREARALFAVSRSLATRDSTAAALDTISQELRQHAVLDRIWIAIGADPAGETVAADSGGGPLPPTPARFRVLQRSPGDEPARWALVQRPGATSRLPGPVDVYRVRIEASGVPLGSIWAIRQRALGEPDRTLTRLLAAAADQIGQALAQDRAGEQTRAAEIARQSDALKSALLQSVSHDLRTPLASIRAAVGGLRPGESRSDADRQASADAIEREVEYLDRVVTNLLDLSRIEAGALRARRDVYDLDDLLARSVESCRARLGDGSLVVDLEVPPVEVDPVFLDEAVTNVLDNAIKYGVGGSRIKITAREFGTDLVRLTIEDDGPGVPEELLARLFEKFYRVPGRKADSRPGTGIGLAVTRGLVEAMGGQVAARRSELGGLAVDIDLPAGTIPAGLDHRTPTPAGAP